MRPGQMAAGTMLVLVTALAVGLLVFLNPSQEAPPRKWPSPGALSADERSGYYRQDERLVRLALPGAYAGYRLYDADRLHAETFSVAAADATRVSADKQGSLTFTDEGYVLRRRDGSQITARKVSPQPWSVRDVSVEHGDVTLAGWLFTPLKQSGVGVVIVHGSGRSDRDNAWYVTLADRLARSGATVLLPDKRGSGRSGGHWWYADYERLADDASAWLDLLATRMREPARIGYVGVSQGGRIAPIAAIRHGKADFIAILSTAATTQNEQLRHEIAADARAQGAPPWLARIVAPLFAQRVRNRRPGWWRAVGGTDPLDEWRAADMPLFIAYGAQDEDDNVSVIRSVSRIREAFDDDPRIRLHVYEGVGHGYILEKEHIILPRFLHDLASWLDLNSEVAARPFDPHR